MPVILALGRLRQENPEFKDRLGYIVSSRPACYILKTYLKKRKKKRLGPVSNGTLHVRGSEFNSSTTETNNNNKRRHDKTKRKRK
jgi:hypothetical protein